MKELKTFKEIEKRVNHFSANVAALIESGNLDKYEGELDDKWKENIDKTVETIVNYRQEFKGKRLKKYLKIIKKKDKEGVLEKRLHLCLESSEKLLKRDIFDYYISLAKKLSFKLDKNDKRKIKKIIKNWQKNMQQTYLPLHLNLRMGRLQFDRYVDSFKERPFRWEDFYEYEILSVITASHKLLKYELDNILDKWRKVDNAIKNKIVNFSSRDIESFGLNEEEKEYCIKLFKEGCLKVAGVSRYSDKSRVGKLFNDLFLDYSGTSGFKLSINYKEYISKVFADFERTNEPYSNDNLPKQSNLLNQNEKGLNKEFLELAYFLCVKQKDNSDNINMFIYFYFSGCEANGVGADSISAYANKYCANLKRGAIFFRNKEVLLELISKHGDEIKENGRYYKSIDYFKKRIKNLKKEKKTEFTKTQIAFAKEMIKELKNNS